MKKEIPDSFVPQRAMKTYPTELGSTPFSPDNIELFKLSKTSKLQQHFKSKFNELQKEYLLLVKEIELNERLYKAKHNFEPITGEVYYLYSNEGGEILSLLSPDEWKTKWEYIGKFQLESTGNWIEVL
jgi:hypothetical protein